MTDAETRAAIRAMEAEAIAAATNALFDMRMQATQAHALLRIAAAAERIAEDLQRLVRAVEQGRTT